MSSARGRASRRDDNEPEIRKRFAVHGWHTETLSAPGMPDLLAFHVRVHATGVGFEPRTYLVDVKGAKGKPTPAQVEKWTALAAAGIPVYVCRTRADVDALVAGMLEAWEPDVPMTGTIRAPLLHGYTRRLSSGVRPRPATASVSLRSKPQVEHANMSLTFDEEVMKRVAAKLAREEEASIPARATAELKRRGK